ncbi:MAG: AEC family transporter [Lachnospiraceae bacterium]|nr:AEC family transporter [Lachnospiraceae bacterium]
MSALNDVIELQVIIFLIMLVGVILTKKNIITAQGRKCLTDLLIDVFLPCNIICSFMIEMNQEILKSTVIVLLVALGIQIVCYLLGKVIYWFAPKSQKMVLQYATMCSNAGFMGNPIIEGIYGSQGLLYASVYLIPLRFFMWSAGLFCFTKSSFKDALKKLAVHPCIIAVWIGFIFMFSQWTPPTAVYRTLKYLSGCTLPVSMLVIGSILAGVQIKSIISKMTLYYTGIRLLAIPLITLLVCRLFNLDSLVTGVSVILAGMPAGSTTAILAEKYDGDAAYASKIVFLSTLLSLVTIPILFWLV